MIKPSHIFATLIVGLVAFFSVVLYSAIDDRRAMQTEKNIDHNDYVIKTQRVFALRTNDACLFKVKVFLTHKQSFDPKNVFMDVRQVLDWYYFSKSAATVDLTEAKIMELMKFPYEVHAITLIPTGPVALSDSQIVKLNKERAKNKLQPFH